MSNGRILTQSERDRAIMSQLENENADLEWKRMAAEANAQISIAGQANWRTRAIAAEAKVAELEMALISALAPFGRDNEPGGVFIRQGFAAQRWELVAKRFPANGVEFTLKRRAALSQQGGEHE